MDTVKQDHVFPTTTKLPPKFMNPTLSSSLYKSFAISIISHTLHHSLPHHFHNLQTCLLLLLPRSSPNAQSTLIRNHQSKHSSSLFLIFLCSLASISKRVFFFLIHLTRLMISLHFSNALFLLLFLSSLLSPVVSRRTLMAMFI